MGDESCGGSYSQGERISRSERGRGYPSRGGGGGSHSGGDKGGERKGRKGGGGES